MTQYLEMEAKKGPGMCDRRYHSTIVCNTNDAAKTVPTTVAAAQGEPFSASMAAVTSVAPPGVGVAAASPETCGEEEDDMFPDDMFPGDGNQAGWLAVDKLKISK